MAPELEQARRRIDELDVKFIRLLSERMKAIQEIGGIKRDDPKSPLRDYERERRIFENWGRHAESEGLSDYFVGRILREILNYSRRRQAHQIDRAGVDGQKEVVRVGYQGVADSYSDLAITSLFATREVPRLERKGFTTFRAVTAALEAGQIDYAMLPVENSIAGSINEVYNLLARRRLTIIDEEIWPVEHCLGGVRGATLEEVSVVRSHPVALQQCTGFLESLVGCTAEICYDTAAAARSVAHEDNRNVAAICSEQAALALGLDVIRREIADQPVNLTRFLLVAREAEKIDARQPCKTSLVLTVNHRRGALASCLQAFAAQDVNLTKLESRPRPEAPWEYLFYVDIVGHGSDPRVAAALTELRSHTNHLKVLGSYPRRTAVDAADSLKPLKRPAPAPAKEKPVRARGTPAAECAAAPDDKLRLCSLREDSARTVLSIGGVEVGGDRFTLIAGPCAVESEHQINEAASIVKKHGAAMLRGGAFKPRSSPYSFQGLGFAGVDLLVDAGRTYELPVVTEVLQPEDIDRLAETVDVLQVGARNMQNFSLLKQLGTVNRPVLLKRGLSATIEEVLMAAEYIMAGGNHQVILCERGIRTFETATRSTLDVSAVPVLKSRTHLPVIVDPSHAAGVRPLVVPLALAAAAVGADGLIVEMHPRPEEALCDKEQALTPDDLGELYRKLEPIITSQGRSL